MAQLPVAVAKKDEAAQARKPEAVYTSGAQAEAQELKMAEAYTTDDPAEGPAVHQAAAYIPDVPPAAEPLELHRVAVYTPDAPADQEHRACSDKLSARAAALEHAAPANSAEPTAVPVPRADPSACLGPDSLDRPETPAVRHK